jgi:threonine dehydratase
MQDIFSFKIRGAANKIDSLTAEKKSNGLVAASSGNHAQAVAFLSNQNKINSIIVMPEITPQIKIDSVKSFGKKYVDVVLHGNNYDESYSLAKTIEYNNNKTLIKPFDDKYIISGNGTIAKELIESNLQMDKIFVPCGGGGLLAGIAVYMKLVKPSIKIIGVEHNESAGMTNSLINNEITSLTKMGIFADGSAVKTVGDETFKLCNEYVDDMITVSTSEICDAIKFGFDDTRVILEPAGALSLAGLYKYIKRNEIKNETIVAITSGANSDFSKLKYISKMTEINETLISVKISESRGSFTKLYNDISDLNGLITEFNYRYVSAQHDSAQIYLSFKSEKNILNELNEIGYELNDLTENTLAKLHIRHLSVNNLKLMTNEFIIRFEFSNNDSNLKKLLNTLNVPWNISLFHYKNDGGDISSILIGFQIPDNDVYKFHNHLNKLNYKFYDETENYNKIIELNNN